jgi:hypothetical protein
VHHLCEQGRIEGGQPSSLNRTHALGGHCPSLGRKLRSNQASDVIVVHCALQDLPFHSFAITIHGSIYSLNIDDRQTTTIHKTTFPTISKFAFNPRLDEPMVHQESEDDIEVIQNLGEAYGLQIGIRTTACRRR